MTSITWNWLLQTFDFATCGFSPHRDRVDSFMRPIVSLRLPAVGFVGNLELKIARRWEGCEQTVTTVGGKDSALPDVSEAREAPLPCGRGGQNSGREDSDLTSLRSGRNSGGSRCHSNHKSLGV